MSNNIQSCLYIQYKIFNNIKHLKGGFYPKIFSYLKKYVYLCPTFSEVRP